MRPEDEPGTFFRSSSGRSLGTPGYHTPALGGHTTPSYKMVSSIGRLDCVGKRLLLFIISDDTHHGDVAQAVHQSRVTLAENPQPSPPPASMDPSHQEVSIILVLNVNPQSLKEATGPLRPVWERKRIVPSSVAGGKSIIMIMMRTLSGTAGI